MPAARNATKQHSRAHRRPIGSRTALVDLPATGSELPVPRIPAGVEWTNAQKGRWRELWRSPQATQWDETCRGAVARLVAYEAAIWSGEAAAWQAQEARHAEEALGLTPKALTALGWRIVDQASIS